VRLAYGDETYEGAFADRNEEDFLELAGNVTKGVPIASPVFDGAKEADVNDALTRAGFRHLGAVRGVRRPLGRAVRSARSPWV
jgi:DNA-directed RNA polymerase subunit beta